MKKILVLFTLSTFASAHAETQLSCWNIFAQKDSAPIIKGQILENNVLRKVTLDPKDRMMQSYVFENDSWEGHKCRHTSKVTDPVGKLTPKEITSNRSSYKGNNQYEFEFGEWTMNLNENDSGTYTARLILPTNLSNDFLKSYRIRNQSERSNGVLVMDPPHFSPQTGQNYLRVFCKAE